MGNYRFRVSDMIPNAWFYKLKDMGNKTRNPTISHTTKRHPPNTGTPFPTSPKHHHPYLSPLLRHSSPYFSNSAKLHYSTITTKASDTHLPDPPTQSTTNRRRRRRRKRKNPNANTNTDTATTPCSVSARCTCRTTLDSFEKPVIFDTAISSWSSSSNCRFSSSSNDIIIDVDSNRSFSTQMLDKFNSSFTDQKSEDLDRFTDTKFERFNEFNSISELDLPPILTKLPKFGDRILNLKKKESEPRNLIRSSTRIDERNVHEPLFLKEETSPVRRLSSSLPPKGLKIRAHSPRLASKKIQAYCRKSNSTSPMTPTKTRKKRATEGFAVVKSSFDPEKDFRDSMLEMIVENNIRASRDLEELLACYLSLNSDEYHDMIVEVFEQIRFDLTEI
ncbi:hypothetical protein AAC387_Pa01g0798 [Persea americana]